MLAYLRAGTVLPPFSAALLAGAMLVKVVARSGRELVAGGLDVKVCAASPATALALTAEAPGFLRTGDERR